MSGTLHCLQHLAARDACFSRLSAGASLVLFDDAVVLALADHPESQRLAGFSVHVLYGDLVRLGLASEKLAEKVALIEWSGMVTLVASHGSQVCWSAGA
jgi:sulfur relay protein TusB/DsrH